MRRWSSACWMPASMMLIGRHFEESTIYKAAYAFEQNDDCKTM